MNMKIFMRLFAAFAATIAALAGGASLTPVSAATVNCYAVQRAAAAKGGYVAGVNAYYDCVKALTVLPGAKAGKSAAGALPTVTGVPAKAVNVEMASGAFKPAGGTLGATFAEPGKLLVGWDYPEELLNAAEGAVERFNPANQYVLRGKQDDGNVPEGGFAMFALGGGKITAAGKSISLPFVKGTGYVVTIRGNYADNEQDEDLNVTAEVTGFASAHALYMRYPGEPNGGFISAGQLNQVVGQMHSGATNCGREGCSRVRVVTLDLNTGGYAIWEHTSGGWISLGGNF